MYEMTRQSLFMLDLSEIKYFLFYTIYVELHEKIEFCSTIRFTVHTR